MVRVTIHTHASFYQIISYRGVNYNGELSRVYMKRLYA